MDLTMKDIVRESLEFTQWMMRREDTGVDPALIWRGIILSFAIACRGSQLDAHKLVEAGVQAARLITQVVDAHEIPEVIVDAAERG